MNNMIDMYLAMNMCERDGNDIFFIGGEKPKHVATIKKHEIIDGQLNLYIVPKQSIEFIKFNVVVTKDGVEVEE